MFWFSKSALAPVKEDSEALNRSAEEFVMIEDSLKEDEVRQDHLQTAVASTWLGSLSGEAQQTLLDAIGTTDLSIVTRDNVTLDCHRSQLATTSTVFETLLEGLPAGEVLQLEATFDAFAPLVDFIYGKVEDVNSIESAPAILHEATTSAAAAQAFGAAGLWARAEELLTWYTHHHIATSTLLPLIEAAESFGFKTAFNNCITWAARNVRTSQEQDRLALQKLSPQALLALYEVREEVHEAALEAYQKSARELATRHEMAWQGYFIKRSQGGTLAGTTIRVRAETSAVVREWAASASSGLPPPMTAAIERAYPRSRARCRATAEHAPLAVEEQSAINGNIP